MGHASTLDYVAAAAGAVLRETGLLPHINAGGRMLVRRGQASHRAAANIPPPSPAVQASWGGRSCARSRRCRSARV